MSATTGVECLNTTECGLRPGGRHVAGTTAAKKCRDRTARQNSSRAVAARVSANPPGATSTSPSDLRRYEARGRDVLRSATNLKGRGAAAAATVVRDLASGNPRLAAALSARYVNEREVMVALGEAVGEPYRSGPYGRVSVSATRIAELVSARAGLGEGELTRNSATPASTEGYEGDRPAARAPRVPEEVAPEVVDPHALTGPAGDFADYLGISASRSDSRYFEEFSERNPLFGDLLDDGFDSAHAADFVETIAEDLGVPFDLDVWNDDPEETRRGIEAALVARRGRP